VANKKPGGVMNGKNRRTNKDGGKERRQIAEEEFIK
jgi:hypothetical protein